MDWTYRFYIADSIFAYADDKRLTMRLDDLISKTKKAKEPEKTAEEIIQDVITRHGIRLEE